MKILFVMQGPPGSGKSTRAAEIAKEYPGAVIHSTDDLRMVDGKYVFDPAQSDTLHKKNLHNAIASMLTGCPVIIDNTNLEVWEVSPYVLHALLLGYTVRFVRCEGSYPNVHGVPPAKVESMRKRMQDLSVEEIIDSHRWEML